MIKSLPNLYSFLRLPEVALKAILENLDYFYTSKIQPKIKYGEYQRDDLGNIKYRQLLIPSYILKSRQKYTGGLLHKIALPHYMYGSVRGKDNILNARQHLNHNYFLTIDLKKFFPNISHYQVYKMLLDCGFSTSVSRLLTRLTTYRSSLPQGAPSSPVIGNLVLLESSNKLYKVAASNNITFTSFLDDLSFSANHCFKKLIPVFLDIIKQGGFYPSYDKVHYRKGYCEITGLFIRGNRLELPYQMAKKARANFFLKSYERRVHEHNLEVQN